MQGEDCTPYFLSKILLCSNKVKYQVMWCMAYDKPWIIEVLSLACILIVEKIWWGFTFYGFFALHFHLQNESLREQSHRLHESEPTFCWNRKNKTMTSKFIKCWLSFTIYRISYSLAASTTRNQFFAGIEKTKQWPANFKRFFFVDFCVIYRSISFDNRIYETK